MEDALSAEACGFRRLIGEGLVHVMRRLCAKAEGRNAKVLEA